MLFNTILLLLTTTFIHLTAASPLHRRQQNVDCGIPTPSCALHSGTNIWFEPRTGASCPTITPPAEVALPAVTQRSNPASCYFPASLDFCAMGQAELMTAMSSIATRIYNAQTYGAVVCGSTKTANLPIITPASKGGWSSLEC
jgi:hypothetical protein